MTNRTVPASTPATAIGARLHAALPVERWGATGFPGRWVGGAAIVLGPPLMTAGALLRVRFPFFYPDQLTAYERHPTLMATAYGLFAAGSVLLWPAVAVLAARMGRAARDGACGAESWSSSACSPAPSTRGSIIWPSNWRAPRAPRPPPRRCPRATAPSMSSPR